MWCCSNLKRKLMVVGGRKRKKKGKKKEKKRRPNRRRWAWDGFSGNSATMLTLNLVRKSVRLCLVQCKIFSGNVIFGKGKYFQVFGCIMKIVLENIFMCLVTL